MQSSNQTVAVHAPSPAAMTSLKASMKAYGASSNSKPSMSKSSRHPSSRTSALQAPSQAKSMSASLPRATVNAAAAAALKARPALKAPAPSHRVQAPDLVKAKQPTTSTEAIDGLDAVLFLDVDGVLHSPNPRHARQQFQRSCMEFLKSICEETKCKIVLSTTWRLHEEARTHLAMKLAEHGIPNFVSRTPSIAQFQRPKEILAWVNKHNPKAWVAVDDWPLHEDLRMHGHFVQTRNRYGLQADVSTRRRTRCSPPVLTDSVAPVNSRDDPSPRSYARVLPLDGGSRVRVDESPAAGWRRRERGGGRCKRDRRDKAVNRSVRQMLQIWCSVGSMQGLDRGLLPEDGAVDKYVIQYV